MKFLNVKCLFVLIALLIFCFPISSFAAQMFFDSKSTTNYIGEDFLLSVLVNTEQVSVNAIEGIVTFPSGLLDLAEVRSGNSLINFWIEEPHLSKPGEIFFSGITPGGFYGEDKFLFSLVFRAKKLGGGSVLFKDLQLLENNGSGTKVLTTILPYYFNVIEDLNHVTENLTVIDNDPPEEFIPLVSRDENLFDGKYFVAFSAVDKGSGIEQYTISESFLGPNGRYYKAESPYVLRDQSLRKNIYIKAIDKSGNARLVKIKAQNEISWLSVLTIFGTIIVVLCILISKKIWPKYFQ